MSLLLLEPVPVVVEFAVVFLGFQEALGFVFFSYLEGF